MNANAISKARDFIKKRSFFVWYTKNYNHLSLDSIVESTLNYGDWSDFTDLKNILGIDTLKSVFKNLTGKKRVNLGPKTVNYFSKYFQKYA